MPTLLFFVGFFFGKGMVFWPPFILLFDSHPEQYAPGAAQLGVWPACQLEPRILLLGAQQCPAKPFENWSQARL